MPKLSIRRCFKISRDETRTAQPSRPNQRQRTQPQLMDFHHYELNTGFLRCTKCHAAENIPPGGQLNILLQPLALKSEIGENNSNKHTLRYVALRYVTLHYYTPTYHTIPYRTLPYPCIALHTCTKQKIYIYIYSVYTEM